ncbi:hypothetical protein E6C67_10625 [Azospirillum sp. TSA2s]|uniref:hypothetical protein n=1 Tax=Azospirillum sp. TSA2s TaxID=709810 RepID=UPI0010AA1377|nr:hypothetical protein [Azospirillum sp. TSA2s]QCG94390.1 hypothetical protein E6C67_10625 [Azospirillum sp. TSA2s]
MGERPPITHPASHHHRCLYAPMSRAVAVACGYRDWHELEIGHAAAELSTLDEHLPEGAFRERAIALVLSLGASLEALGGDVQAALSDMRLTGNRAFTYEDHETIRTACWRAGPIPWKEGRHPGVIFRIKSSGFSATEPHWWRRSTVAVKYIDHTTSNGLCATFEAVVPRTRMADFVPRRLWLPYGWMDMEDGSRVLFSRDYLPLWRIADGKVKRLKPTDKLPNYRDQKWFPQNGEPWSYGPARESAERMLGGIRHHGPSSVGGHSSNPDPRRTYRRQGCRKGAGWRARVGLSQNVRGGRSWPPQPTAADRHRAGVIRLSRM